MTFALAVTGPTASGKTAISLDLAERFNAEIISCDSMQVYKKMDIGTAKATAREQARAPHHLIDFLSPDESFSAESYRSMAIPLVKEISSRGRLPMFVGGTGLYIDSVIRGGEASSPESDPEYRECMLALANEPDGIDRLWERLNSVDPDSAEKIHKNNVKRVIRALEIFDKTGKTKTELDRETKHCVSDVRVGMITLDFHNRDNLYKRVDARVDAMLGEGLLEEVRSLYSEGLLDGKNTASQAIGYKELLSFIRGEKELSDSLEELKLATRRYAKRQLTWFRHETDAVRLYLDSEDGIMRPYAQIIEEATSIAEDLIKHNMQFCCER